MAPGRHPRNDVTYLNNRHYDPTTGVFVSVDPLVTMTGEPYIYGSANPVTISDPTGLCGCEFFGDPTTKESHEIYGADYNPRYVDSISDAGTQSKWSTTWRSDWQKPGATAPRSPLNLDWANCLTSGTLASCGSPSGGDGSVGKGLHSYRQAWWCLSRANDCEYAYRASNTAEGQTVRWKSDERFENFDRNAMMHALWMAMLTDHGMSDSDVRALGVAHEMDWRDDYLDAGRDLLNNEVGISIGNEQSGYVAVVAAIEQAALDGILWCVSGGSAAPALRNC